MIISKEIQFDAGHRVTQHAGKCSSLHGHRYRVVAYVDGAVQSEGEKDGMVIDFGLLKSTLMELVQDTFDHSMILWKDDPLVDMLTDKDNGIDMSLLNKLTFPSDYGYSRHDTEEFGNVVVTAAVPTAENLAFTIWNRINIPLAELNIKLVKLEVWETPTSCAILEKERDGV